MEQQLSLLLQLQEIDQRIRLLAEKKNNFPDILAGLEKRRSDNKQALETTKEALLTAQKNKRDRDKDLEAGGRESRKTQSAFVGNQDQ